MHAFLVITSDGIHEEKIAEFTPGIKRIIPYTLSTIADTKELNRQASNSYSEKTGYLISDFDKASVEAQNAFLKNLEEAQSNLVYILTAANEDAVLPTIISRCQVVRVKRNRVNSDESAEAFINLPVSEKLAKLAKITKREEAIELLENIIANLEIKLPQDTTLANDLKVANEAYSRIKQNANPTLQLTWFAVRALPRA